MKNKLYHITNLRKYALLFTFLCFTMSALAQKTATKDTIAKDTLKAKPVEKTPEQKRAEDYAKLIKKATLERKGLFTVRKADERWYFEIPDSLIGRYFLCITRLKSAPQGLGKYAGESVNEQTIYFEQKTDKTLQQARSRLYQQYLRCRAKLEGKPRGRCLQRYRAKPKNQSTADRYHRLL